MADSWLSVGARVEATIRSCWVSLQLSLEIDVVGAIVYLERRIYQGTREASGGADGTNHNYFRSVAGNDETANKDICTRSDQEPGGYVYYARRWWQEGKRDGGSAVPICGKELDTSKKCAPREFRLAGVRCSGCLSGGRGL